MQNKTDNLWQINRIWAFISIPLIWLFFVIIFILGQKYAGWSSTLESTIIIIVAAISFFPTVLVLLDFFSAKRAVLDLKGFKIDFSNISLDAPGIRRESFGLPDNIGISGQIVTDSLPMSIIETLEVAVDHDIVVLNIQSGDAWWVTRLLALSAGAVRAGSPAVLVFIGKKENVPNTFIGWGRPKDILNAILNDKEEYRARYNKAIVIARQVLLYSHPDLKPPDFPLPNDVLRYTGHNNYTNLGEAVTEQIILDQLANSFTPEPDGSLENPPDKLTLNRINELFGHCLYKDSIDLNHKNENQIEQLLNAKAPYVALVKEGQYDSILKQTEGERLILKELFRQSKKNVNS